MSAALRATAVFASLLAAGCYGVENDLESDTAALSASEDGATSNVGSLDAPRGIEELDGFLLYWKQHSNWEHHRNASDTEATHISKLIPPPPMPDPRPILDLARSRLFERRSRA